MYLESSKKLIRDAESEHKRRLSRTYLHVEIVEKLKKICDEKDITFDWYGFSTEMVYFLKKTESLSFDANLLLESIDEILFLKDMGFRVYEEFDYIEFLGTYGGKHNVVLRVYYGGSDHCKVAYEDVIMKKATLICE